MSSPAPKLAELEGELERVKEAIGAYPAPIPACDAQFNHLLEERSRLSEEISRLRART